MKNNLPAFLLFKLVGHLSKGIHPTSVPEIVRLEGNYTQHFFRKQENKREKEMEGKQHSIC
ncbi:MAG: hypothetical protein GC192_00925 [Bacteroidetes bacterium]|nr:hypothetical protein [Bacteroidota bacterium]